MSKHKLALFLILTTLSQANASDSALRAFMTGKKIDPKYTNLCKQALAKVGADLASYTLSPAQTKQFDSELTADIKKYDREAVKEAGRKHQQKTATRAHQDALAARSARHRHK